MKDNKSVKNASDLPFEMSSQSKRLFRREQKVQANLGIFQIICGLAVLVLILIFSNQYFNHSAEKYAKEQVKETMTEVSASLSSAFSDRMNAWYEELSMAGQFISLYQFDQKDEYIEEVYECLSKIQFNRFEQVGMLTEDGYLILSNGKYYQTLRDPSVWEFLKLRPKRSCFSVKNIEELSDTAIFAIPYYKSQAREAHPIAGIIGTVSKENFAEVLDTKAFGISYSYIVISDDEGNVIVDTKSKRAFGNNIFSTFNTFADKKTSNRLIDDLKSGNSNTMELMGVTERFLIYYAPVNPTADTDTPSTSLSSDNWRILVLTSSAALNKNIVNFSMDSRLLLYLLLAVISVLLLAISIYSTRRNRKLLYKDSVDPMTGLLNANRFKADANLLLQSDKEKYVVATINILRFKVLNSKFGHHGADEILREVGMNIQDFLRPDEIAGRTYSDHFTVLLNMETEQGDERLSLLKEHVEKASYSYDYQIELTMGAYRIKDTDESITLPLDYATHAQSLLKNDLHPQKRIEYYDDAAIEKHQIELKLTELAPIALKKQEFAVYYQLKRSTDSRDSWVGCEALVRWKSSELGFLSPGNFIPLFESTGFVVPLDHYVFETVCQDLQKSLTENRKILPVSVNLSRKHFDDPDFLDHYEAILEKYDIPRELIEFEITETLAVSDTEKVQAAIERIHNMGCKCALDDFGTGYASFDMLMSFNLDTLKLDATIFRAHPHLDKSRRVIIETLIDLAHRLDMCVVAEGVETTEQAEFLAKNHCDAGQGYYYAKPLSYQALCEELEAEDL